MSSGQTFSPAVIVPAYNSGPMVLDVLRRARPLGLPIIVVDDGSTDGTAARLARWAERERAAPITVLTHESNRGKAAALRTGFAAAREAGHTHAATIDADGQLEPEQVPRLLREAEANPRSLVLGVRSTAAANYPRASRLGRSFSNLAILLECGRRVHDSQCGLRVYPLAVVEAVGARAGRFAFEAEIITRAVWGGAGVVETPVRCRYLPPGEQATHFRTVRDSLHGLALHARLTLRALSPWPHRRCRPDGEPPRPPFWRSVLQWLNPARAWRQVVDPDVERGEVAAAMALGVFVANLPIYPFQTLACLYLAARLHLHPAVALAGTMISMPPISVLLVGGAIAVGHTVLNGAWPDWSHYHINFGNFEEWLALLGGTFAELGVGSLLLGMTMAGITFALTYLSVGFIRRRRAERLRLPAEPVDSVDTVSPVDPLKPDTEARSV